VGHVDAFQVVDEWVEVALVKFLVVLAGDRFECCFLAIFLEFFLHPFDHRHGVFPRTIFGGVGGGDQRSQNDSGQQKCSAKHRFLPLSAIWLSEKFSNPGIFWCGDSMNAATLCQAAGQRADWRQRRRVDVQRRTTHLKSANV
jgi:hypothetical protein